MEKSKTNKLMELGSLKPGDVFDSAAGKHIVLGHMEDGTTKVIRQDFYAEDVAFSSGTCDCTKSLARRLAQGT